MTDQKDVMPDGLRITVYLSREDEQVDVGDGCVDLPRFRKDWDYLLEDLMDEITDRLLGHWSTSPAGQAILVEMFPCETLSLGGRQPNGRNGRSFYTPPILTWSGPPAEEVMSRG